MTEASHQKMFAAIDAALASKKAEAEQKRRDEIEARRHAETQAIWRAHAATWHTVGVPGRYNGCNFENFKAETELQRKALAACKRFPYLSDDEDDIRSARNLWLLGPVGRGKTHLACAVLRAQHQAGLTAVFTTPRDLIRDLRASWGERNSAAKEQQALARYTDCDVLVLDDVGASFGKEAELVQLFDVINERDAHDMRTIITSNLTPKALLDVLGDRIFSRLRDQALVLTLDGDDHRQPLA